VHNIIPNLTVFWRILYSFSLLNFLYLFIFSSTSICFYFPMDLEDSQSLGPCTSQNILYYIYDRAAKILYTFYNSVLVFQFLNLNLHSLCILPRILFSLSFLEFRNQAEKRKHYTINC
jgi:hypothetical protein